MGKDLAERFPAAMRVFEEVDDALGIGLSRVMWEGPEEELTRTHNAQPAILAHTLAVFAVVREVLEPRLGAGHSLGEYSAYVAAGSLSVADGAKVVRRRGQLMWDAGQQRPGAMAAVLGCSVAVVTDLCLAASDPESVVVPANINAPDQVVISGDPAAVERAGDRLRGQGAKRVLPLKVSGAFHSPLMQPAQDGLTSELASVTMRDPDFPIVANVSAEPTASAEAARELLAAQLTQPVRWVESMQRARRAVGADVPFVEIGPGSVLSGLLRRIDPEIAGHAIGTADQVSAFVEQHA